ncbi:protein PSK SIMULATOR 1-like [Pyrus x bretschneideri]|uniref:protein PSK SIMULATOR 1-like n=1 Tax=Pyrus x bretschneideri TaxID=225117 RepID=UPI00202FBDC4|nr:protein PSK SIMULATOR 1-like [Pyrus x bretschneideri]
MGGEIVSGSWFGSLRFSWSRLAEADKPVIGILAFEIAGLMLKMVNLWNSVSENEMLRLREEIVNLIGVRRLVSDNDDYLMELALNEIIEDLGYLAMSVVRLGKKCTDPVYHRFEEIFEDPVENGFQWLGWAYRWSKMERKVKKMEKFVEATMQLSQELEVLAELEQTLRRMRANPEVNRVKLLEFQQKVMWRRQQVKILQDMSPWSRTYDYIVRLLARSLFTMLEKIKLVFGFNQMALGEGMDSSEVINSVCLSHSHSFSALMHSSVHPSDGNPCGFYSEPLGRSLTKPRFNAGKNRTNKQRQAHHQSSIQHGSFSQLKAKRFAHVRPFKECMTGGSNSPALESCKPDMGGSMSLRSTSIKHFDDLKYTHMGSQSLSHGIYSKLSLFSSKCTLLNAPPSTLGDAALALHYAYVIVLIEKIASSPHLISLDERSNLYNMLTTTIRAALRARLKSYAKTMGSSVYNPALAGEWNRAMEQILGWLAPLAHNMIQWHSDHNIVKQQKVSKTNVLLVQTLYFASQAKTEDAITELLIGLNYMCMVDELNRKAMRDAGGSRPYDDYMLKQDEIA